jgi:hypothetical protein
MRCALTCLGVGCLLGITGCGDSELKERVSALEKENRELRAELDKLRKAETDAKVREAAARVQAKNNLKQLSIAVKNYQGDKLPKFADPKTQGLFQHILPHLENSNLWQRDPNLSYVPNYLSPSDPAGAQGSKLPKDQATQNKEPGGKK